MMFVLGTAGHIDHGKSALVTALTGINPDRLPEEITRGMTIDLGFAWLKLPSGEEIGIIDVPGHERFVRNMVAGAGGINAAMLVVAADDGWMPQTQEHLDILTLLDVRYGLVALTKIDLVEPDWLTLVEADVRKKVSGTFLAEAPIVPVSSVTGQGVKEVIESISDISAKIKTVEDIGKLRLFIDRSFVLTGVGVVVTGTTRGGGLTTDSDVYLFPSGNKTKIRVLQSHEQKVTRVGTGQRVAVNLSGIDREKIKRGHVLTNFACPDKPAYLTVKIKNLKNSNVVLKEGRKVLLILGTTETEAIIRPFDDNGIKPGREDFAIIKTVEPLAAFVKDTFIIRLPTPPTTIGGGIVLDLLEQYPRRKDLPSLTEYLNLRSDGDLPQIILTELSKPAAAGGLFFSPVAGFLTYSNFSKDQIEAAVRQLENDKRIVCFEEYLAATDRINSFWLQIKHELEKTHKEKPYLKGLTVDELSKFLSSLESEQVNLLLRYFRHERLLEHSQQYFHLPGVVPTLNEEMNSQANLIMAEVEKAGHNYLTQDDIEFHFPNSRVALSFLRQQGRLKTTVPSFIMSSRVWGEIIAYVEKKLMTDGKLSVGEFRDRFGNSRKYALTVLEYFDRAGITRREGDFRVKGNKFDERHSL